MKKLKEFLEAGKMNETEQQYCIRKFEEYMSTDENWESGILADSGDREQFVKRILSYSRAYRSQKKLSGAGK